MAAPIDTYIQLPADTGNTGKLIRTQTRVVGANTVHVHNFVPWSNRLIKGVYYTISSVYTVLATAQNGTSSAVWWLQVPTTATVNVRVRKLDVYVTNLVATAVDHDSAPRFVFSRFTHADGWAGATQSVAKRKTTDSSNQADCRTAATGASPSLVGIAWATLLPGADITTSGVYSTSIFYQWNPFSEDDFIDLAPGEGLVAYQIDNGTTNDQRRLNVNLGWDEYDNQ